MEKIIFVAEDIKIGGVETSFINLAKYVLADCDIELHLLKQNGDMHVVLPKNIIIKKITNNIDDLFSLSVTKNVITIIRKYGICCYVKKFFYTLMRHFGKNHAEILADYIFPDVEISNCDACFVLKENEPTIFYALDKVACKKRICFFHTAKYLADDYISVYCSKKITDIVTVSHGNRDFLCHKMPKAVNKIHVIHNALNIDEIHQKAVAYSVDEMKVNTFNIVSVCRVNEEKGVDFIIKAANQLKRENLKFRWFIVGPCDKGYTEQYWNDKIKEYDVEDCVVLTGAKENPYPYIKNADLVANLSRIESFGMVIREAQILGVPVVATDTYGGIELVEDRKTGFLVNIDDVEGVVEIVKMLIDNPEYVNFFKDNLVSNDFDENEQIKKQFYDLILE